MDAGRQREQEFEDEAMATRAPVEYYRRSVWRFFCLTLRAWEISNTDLKWFANLSRSYFLL
ncbi:hypothetical protein CRENBAI_005889 [Crenichthys baileyi]|uniref:Uncharacterized protein n=1 Tax=Crenichthys baileyi TaxID=28760 RepID=A0AAV9RGJ1_9TELE